MNRRGFLSTAAATLFAGCSARGGGGGTSQKGDGAKQIGSSSEEVASFVETLESKGVDVDSTMMTMGSLSLMYFQRPKHQRQDRIRVATTYAKNRSVSKNFLNCTVLEPDGESRYGTYMIKQEWAASYASGGLSKSEYLSKIDSTFNEK